MRVAAQMGHADWTMIARVYDRSMPEAALTQVKKPRTNLESRLSGYRVRTG